MSAPVSTVDELITEIASLSDDNKPWLIVEGETDVLFFKQRFLNHNINYDFRGGWSGVNDILKAWSLLSPSEKNNKIIVGVIDRDYHDYIGTMIHENIVMVDYRDLEICMFESDEALNKVLLEFGAPSKLPLNADERVDLAAFRKIIYDKALPLAKLRFFNASSESKITFPKPFKFEKCVSLLPFSIEIEKLVEYLAAYNKCAKELLHQSLSKDIPPEYPANKVCNGHDVICILGRSLQKNFGSNSDSKFVEGSKLEGAFRGSYPNNEFEASDFGKKIIALLGIHIGPRSINTA